MDGLGRIGRAGDVTQCDGAEVVAAGRKRGQHLTQEEREELGHRAVLLHAEGKTYREIAKEVGVHYNTVGGLIREEYDRRKASREEERSRAIAVYRALQRDAWRRLKELPTGSTAQNVTGMHNSIRLEQERIDKITGIEAPTKSERTTTTIDLSKVPDSTVQKLAAVYEEIAQVDPDLRAWLQEWGYVT